MSTGDSGMGLCASGMSLPVPAETARPATAGAVVSTKPVGGGRSALLPAVVAVVVSARTRRRRRRLLMVVAVVLTVGRLQETVAT